MIPLELLIHRCSQRTDDFLHRGSVAEPRIVIRHDFYVYRVRLLCARPLFPRQNGQRTQWLRGARTLANALCERHRTSARLKRVAKWNER